MLPDTAPNTPDPDTAQAVEDVLQTVLDLRAATALSASAYARTPRNLDRCHAADARVQELTDLIASRARSAYLTLDEILGMANERIAADRRLPRAGAERSNARVILDLMSDRDDRQADVEARRGDMATARAALTAAEHRKRLVDEQLRVVLFGPSVHQVA